MTVDECRRNYTAAQAHYRAARAVLEDARDALLDAEQRERLPCGPATHHVRRADAHAEIDWVRGDRTSEGTV